MHYRNEAQQRILRVLLVLGGHEREGLAPDDIAESLDLAREAVVGDLRNLQRAGLAELDQDTGLWRLTPRIAQMGLALLERMSPAQRRGLRARKGSTRKARSGH